MQKGPAEKGVAVGVDLKDAHKRHWDFALVLGDGGVADADKKKDAHKLEKKLKKGHDKIHKGLKKAGLDFTWPPVTLSNETKCIYVTASTERLMQEAEESQLKVDLEPTFGLQGFPEREWILQSCPTDDFDREEYANGKFKTFNAEDSGAVPNTPGRELHVFNSGQRIRMVASILRKRKVQSGAALALDKLVEEKILKLYTPLHAKQALQQLTERWNSCWWSWYIADYTGCGTQGHISGKNRRMLISDVRDYFGEQISFYVAFLGFYTVQLFPLAIVSIPVTVCQYIWNDNMYGMIFYTFFVTAWSAFFLKHWERRSADLRYEWDVEVDADLGYKDQQRPQFKGNMETGFYSPGGWLSLEPYVNTCPKDCMKEEWDRRFKGQFKTHHFSYGQRCRWMGLSAIVVLVCMSLLLCVVVSLLIFKIWVKDLGEYSGGILSGVLNGLSIQLLNLVYEKVAHKLTEWENHRTVQEYENAAVYKLFEFQFINNYSTLLYIAFVKPLGTHHDLELLGQSDSCVTGADDPTNDQGSCYDQLKLQYMGIIIAKLFVDTASDLVKPLVKKRWNAYKLSGKDVGAAMDVVDGERLEEQLVMEPYHSTIHDFNQLVLTFGFVALFGIAWPLGTVVLAAYGVLQNYADSQKLLDSYQRPVPHDQDNLGAWKKILYFVAAIGCCTNVGILAYTMDWFRHHYSLERYEVLWASIVCEHIIFFLWLVILLWVPNDPAFLAKKRALDKFEAEMYARPWAKASATWDSEDDEDDDEDAEVDDKSLQININLIAADGEKNSERV